MATRRGTPAPTPDIPLMQGQVIFVDDLNGQSLDTWLVWSDVQLGHEFEIHWRGRTADGHSVDHLSSVRLVDDQNFENGRVLVSIGYELLDRARGGEVFYSFEVVTASSPNVGESLRLIIFLDRAPLFGDLPPVAQIHSSHGLVIDLSQVPNDVYVHAPPYQAMAKDDVATLTWQGYRSGDDSMPIAPWSQDMKVGQADIGHPLTWKVPRSELQKSNRQHGTLSWRVTHAATREISVSAAQRFSLAPPLPGNRLMVPELPDVKGDVLVPGDYPDGVRVRCPVPDRLLAGDTVLLYWDDGSELWAYAKLVDASVLTSQKLEFTVGAQALAALGQGKNTLSWAFARPGMALASTSLVLTVAQRLALPFPLIDGDSRDQGAPRTKGTCVRSRWPRTRVWLPGCLPPQISQRGWFTCIGWAIAQVANI
ncbi:hypothetical protein [Pseudomonas sp. KNUC1026]|uniref:hypothetical protein n=1 Tax=Pseudomonas sp. KNUC1026 TaxID=2893890 RepID=UPI001F1AD6C0|nr:hypothetical protein [Pseudomonas sp. KNUC1026]UFH48283.1 hypothetical protein LN139_14025 [Pseudomonas sp. KNUC1026]